LVALFGQREPASLERDELQDLLDLKVNRDRLSFSVVDHLRVLDQRERLISKLAIVVGMRPGEVFALT